MRVEIAARSVSLDNFVLILNTRFGFFSLFLHIPLNQNDMTRNFKVFIDQFIPFLASYEASDSYVSNFVASFSFLPLSLFINSTTVDFWIEGAFTFADTPEGLDFWTRVNKEWRSIAKYL